ncbi:MAG TPA: helix-turn-helix domain-containing protein [Candidatus Krumholzibacteria bacterium]|nr:helix-turn-helix domain-containing protein [Candidatus Krumholzibacteria bacterium]
MSAPTTKDRLLDEAEKLFAHNGFDAVSVRDIAAAAEANAAAINYHFQSKENLYQEVLRRRILPKRERLLAMLDEVEGMDQAERLEAVFRGFARVHLDDAIRRPGGALVMLLMSRELTDPRPEVGLVVAELVQPIRARMLALLQPLLPALTPRDQQLLIGSHMGQIVYFAVQWNKLQAQQEAGLPPFIPLPALAVDVETYVGLIIDHVTRITVAGARAMQEEASA